jgi:hypothetical protein
VLYVYIHYQVPGSFDHAHHVLLIGLWFIIHQTAHCWVHNSAQNCHILQEIQVSFFLVQSAHHTYVNENKLLKINLNKKKVIKFVIFTYFINIRTLNAYKKKNYLLIKWKSLGWVFSRPDLINKIISINSL